MVSIYLRNMEKIMFVLIIILNSAMITMLRFPQPCRKVLIFPTLISSHRRKRCLSFVSAPCDTAKDAHFVTSTASKPSKGRLFFFICGVP